MHRFIGLLVALVCGVLAQGQGRLDIEVPAAAPKDKIRWTADYLLALEEARLRNCPVVAVITDDQSIGFQTIQTLLYAAPGFLEQAARGVFLVAFDGAEHDFEMREVDGVEVEWCLLFDLPCKEHRRMHKVLLDRLITREFWNPMHVLLDAEGVEIHRMEGHEIRLPRFQEDMDFTQEQLGEKTLSFAAYRELKLAVKETVDQRQKRGHTRTVEALQKLMEEEAPPQSFQDWVRELEGHLLAEGEQHLYHADDLMRDGKKKEAKALLKKVQRWFRGHPPAEEAARRLEQIGRPPKH